MEIKFCVRAVFLSGAMLASCRADLIHLKNGITISASQVTQKDGQVQYTVGGTQYSIPQASVSGIDHDSAFGISVGTSKSGLIAAPALPASSSSSNSTANFVSHRELVSSLPRTAQMHGFDSAVLSAQIIRDGRVNERALYDISSEGSSAKSAAAYFIAAQYAYEHSEGEAARRYMKTCLSYEPEDAGLLEWYSVILLDGGQYDDAVTEAQRAVKRAPHSAGALQVLGLAYYDSGHFAQAIETWNHAQQLHPTDAVANYRAKAERESPVEDKFSERTGTHFALRYEGRQLAPRFASELLSTLDRQYGELQRDLGFAPESTITVILYTEQQFFVVTQAPSWAGGLNDGKVRVPVRDLSGVTPQLEAVLRHEMTHSFIHALTHGRCPQWLNEGIAQMEEPRTSGDFAAPLAQLFRDNKQIPLRYLEGSFVRLSPAQAQLAYAESLAAAEYLRSAHGMYSLRRLLELLSDGESSESALRNAGLEDYAELERGLGSYLSKGAP
jgi:tetratricopeptide (TPR) repeat protein